MNWSIFMRRWNDEMLASSCPERVKRFGIEINTDWLGYPGVANRQIVNMEKRLNTELPPSYTEFLKFTNGWQLLSTTIDRIFATNEVDWFKERHQDWIDAYMGPYSEGTPVSDKEHKVYGKAQWTVEFRVEYLQDCLQITPSSSMGSNAVFLLNPKIKTEDGEWEAWYFDDKLAGAERFPSFSELMSNHYQRYFLDLLDE